MRILFPIGHLGPGTNQVKLNDFANIIFLLNLCYPLSTESDLTEAFMTSMPQTTRGFIEVVNNSIKPRVYRKRKLLLVATVFIVL